MIRRSRLLRDALEDFHGNVTGVQNRGLPRNSGSRCVSGYGSPSEQDLPCPQPPNHLHPLAFFGPHFVHVSSEGGAHAL